MGEFWMWGVAGTVAFVLGVIWSATRKPQDDAVSMTDERRADQYAEDARRER